jgi:hypothetical protein
MSWERYLIQIAMLHATVFRIVTTTITTAMPFTKQTRDTALTLSQRVNRDWDPARIKLAPTHGIMIPHHHDPFLAAAHHAPTCAVR